MFSDSPFMIPSRILRLATVSGANRQAGKIPGLRSEEQKNDLEVEKAGLYIGGLIQEL